MSFNIYTVAAVMLAALLGPIIAAAVVVMRQDMLKDRPPTRSLSRHP